MRSVALVYGYEAPFEGPRRFTEKKCAASPLVGTHVADWSGYADDLLLFFDDEESLNFGLHLLDKTFTRYKLTINISKTKSMILNQQYENRDYPISIVSLRGYPLENVKVYTYLRCDIKYDEPLTGDTELHLRADAADCKFYALSKNMMNKKI